VAAFSCCFNWALIFARKASECGGRAGSKGVLTMLLQYQIPVEKTSEMSSVYAVFSDSVGSFSATLRYHFRGRV